MKQVFSGPIKFGLLSFLTPLLLAGSNLGLVCDISHYFEDEQSHSEPAQVDGHGHAEEAHPKCFGFTQTDGCCQSTFLGQSGSPPRDHSTLVKISNVSKALTYPKTFNLHLNPVSTVQTTYVVLATSPPLLHTATTVLTL